MSRNDHDLPPVDGYRIDRFADFRDEKFLAHQRLRGLPRRRGDSIVQPDLVLARLPRPFRFARCYAGW